MDSNHRHRRNRLLHHPVRQARPAAARPAGARKEGETGTVACSTPELPALRPDRIRTDVLTINEVTELHTIAPAGGLRTPLAWGAEPGRGGGDGGFGCSEVSVTCTTAGICCIMQQTARSQVPAGWTGPPSHAASMGIARPSPGSPRQRPFGPGRRIGDRSRLRRSAARRPPPSRAASRPRHRSRRSRHRTISAARPA